MTDSTAPAKSALSPTWYRWRLHVTGVVQGVGFRPFVFRLAQSLSLTGHVYNATTGVVIEIQSRHNLFNTFIARLKNEAPVLARVDDIQHESLVPILHESTFKVIASDPTGHLQTMIGSDQSICEDCLRELFTPTDRRYLYPFINCTHCGARYTLTVRLPYDRATTSMASFVQCPSCAAEYTNIAHRRFHAEPNACPACGPSLVFCDAQQNPLEGHPVSRAAKAIQSGKIVAVKGLGGFHLVCDAKNKEAVNTLRQRKARDAKPFAVMALNTASVKRWCEPHQTQIQHLTDNARPIVLLPKKPTCDSLLHGVAEGMHTLGVMLPYTPLHYLLFFEALNRPLGFDWLTQENDCLWVMTSANPNGEPLVTDNDEAFERLSLIADYFLIHDRAIVARCDDSVMAVNDTRPPMILRRARGFAPASIKLNIPENTPSVLALGGHLKNTICVTRANEAFLSPHIGSLDNKATLTAFEAMIQRFLDFLQVSPALIAHDAHPDFYSTHYAEHLADIYHAPTLAVWHHHAHMMSTVAEHRLCEPALGLAFDGVGLGEDHTLWGGEWLWVNGNPKTAYTRAGHLAPLLLAGGDKAAIETWRPLLAAVVQSESDTLAPSFSSDALACRLGHHADKVMNLLRRAREHPSRHTPLSSGLGRYFDAAAAALGIRATNRFEGESAMLLESLAHRFLATHERLPSDASLARIHQNTLDLKPLILSLLSVTDPSYGAALFHGTLIQSVVLLTEQLARQYHLSTLVLGGGCFVNAILSSHLEHQLQKRGFTVFRPEKAPANDGGLSLGQAYTAALHVASRLQ
ncbi:MAG: carbamoyltransferase HypF [Burkholderiales bacterium]|jgi:hydrogenase maturation protein HypF|nr:carbamoyltransferase HypF [Burkholderiales bacterium]